MLVEVKRPDDYDSYESLMEDQLFAPGKQEYANGVRYVAWYTLDLQNETLRDRCVVIDFRKYTEYRDWVLAGEPGHNLDLPAEYGTVRKQKYVKNSASDLRTDLIRRELTQLQKDFHNVLWVDCPMFCTSEELV